MVIDLNDRMRNAGPVIHWSAWSRRRFIRNSAGTAAALAGGRGIAASSGAMLPLAVQLYSVRKDCAADFDAALEQVAGMGFAGVEFAGYHSYAGKPKELRRRLDDLGLGVAATHIGTATLRGDALAQTIEFHQQIGCKFLIVPADGDFMHPEKSKALAEFFNETAAKLKPLGMACGYHNHHKEFEPVGDSNHWELFAQRTSKDVILQIDCGWATYAGQDPAALMKRHPGRTRTVHFKPVLLDADKGTKKPLLGQDSADWPAVLAACREFGGTEWITIEQEAYPDGLSPMEATGRSLQGLKKIL
jgi:sugar phosphate isomerase/epimerase